MNERCPICYNMSLVVRQDENEKCYGKCSDCGYDTETNERPKNMNRKIIFTAGVWVNATGAIIGEDKDPKTNEIVFFRVHPDAAPSMSLAVKPSEIISFLDLPAQVAEEIVRVNDKGEFGGEFWLEIPVVDWDQVKRHANKILLFNGREYGWSCWNSDRMVSVFRSPPPPHAKWKK